MAVCTCALASASGRGAKPTVVDAKLRHKDALWINVQLRHEIVFGRLGDSDNRTRALEYCRQRHPLINGSGAYEVGNKKVVRSWIVRTLGLSSLGRMTSVAWNRSKAPPAAVQRFGTGSLPKEPKTPQFVAKGGD